LRVSASTGPRVIALCGKAGAGKDLVAAMLYMRGYERIAFADPLRDEVRSAIATHTVPLGAPMMVEAAIRAGDCAAVDRKPTSDMMRYALQWWGKEYRRDRDGEDYWVGKMAARMSPHKRYVITDCRFPNELVFARRQGGVVWRIERDVTVGGIPGHASETALSGIAADLTIHNGGSLHDLAVKVRRALDD
jgi:hypothetical protein